MVCQGPLITQSSNHPEYANHQYIWIPQGALSIGGCCLYECGCCKDALGLPLYLCMSLLYAPFHVITYKSRGRAVFLSLVSLLCSF